MPIFFKNAQVYRISAPVPPLGQTWEDKLREHTFGPCAQQQAVSLGWVPPIVEGGALVHVNGDNILVCLKKQERLLPGPVIQKALREKVDHIQKTEDRRVGSKERQTLKDEIIFSMLPKAFTRDSLHYAYVNFKLGLVVVDAPSGMADTLTSFLRETLGSLPLALFQAHCQPAPVLTSWVADANLIPAGWDLIPDLHMTQSSNSDIKVSLKNVELDSEAVATHLENDGQVVQIAFDWHDRVSAVINAKAQITRIKFSDLITEQVLGAEDRIAQLEVSFLLMATELNGLITECEKLFGGRE